MSLPSRLAASGNSTPQEAVYNEMMRGLHSITPQDPRVHVTQGLIDTLRQTVAPQPQIEELLAEGLAEIFELPQLEISNTDIDDPANYLPNKEGAAFLTELKRANNLHFVILLTQALMKLCVNRECTVLHVATKRHDLAMAKLIVHLDPTLIHIKSNPGGVAPLYQAVEEGRFELAELYLKPRYLLTTEQNQHWKPDVNVTTPKLGTPLHRAASSGFVEIAQLLVECGASKEMEDSYGLTPADYAFFKTFGVGIDALQKQKFQLLAQTLKPARGLLDINTIITRFGYVKAS